MLNRFYYTFIENDLHHTELMDVIAHLSPISDDRNNASVSLDMPVLDAPHASLLSLSGGGEMLSGLNTLDKMNDIQEEDDDDDAPPQLSPNVVRRVLFLFNAILKFNL